MVKPSNDKTPDDRGLGFQPPGFQVDVRQVGAKQWELLAGLEYEAARDHFTLPAQTPTDFASVPRFFVWLIPTYGKYTKAAILHDDLCRKAEAGRFSRREADAIFRQAMRLEGVAFLRRWAMWTGVRLGALKTANSRKEWSKDAVLVVLLTLLFGIVVLPPAALIGVALLIWYVLELIAWLALKASSTARTSQGQPSKTVNRPELSLKM